MTDEPRVRADAAASAQTADLIGLAPTLLSRPEWLLDSAPIRAALDGKCVLVTGAAGSVGAALVSYLCTIPGVRVVAVDWHEPSLFRLRASQGPAAANVSIRYALGDVRDSARMRRLLSQERPTTVYHLAAYKHVPIGEENVDQVVGVNVVGTANLLAACAEAGVDAFVYPSTDKAVNPPSIYGATKRVMERYLLGVDRADAPRCNAVRLINVIGTQGSVVEVFARQVRAGQSLGVTDLRMTRYWMTMAEAVGLVAWAGVGAGARRQFIIDAGPPVLVAETARRISQWLRPDQPVAIAQIGIRPGERLFEELAYQQETLARSEQSGVLEIDHGLGGRVDTSHAATNVAALAEALAAADDATLRQATFAAAHGESAAAVLSGGSSESRP